MPRRRRAATSTRKGVFNPDDSDRIKHTRIGVWDLYEEKTPEIEHVPGGSNIERYLQMKRDLPFVWTMLKDVGSIESCRPLLFFHVLLVLLGSLLPAATLWFKGQLVKIVQVAVDTRTVNKTLLMQITVGLVVIKIVHKIIEHARNFIYYPLSSRLRQYYSLHLFHARARLDVPTFDDEAVQRQLHAVSQVQGNSVAWSTIDAISSLASLTLSIVTQASVLWSVLKDQPDGLLLAALTTLHTMSDMFQWQRSAGILHGVWAATTKDHDFIQLQGLKRIVSDFSHRKEFVAGNLTRYTISLFKTLVDRLGDRAGNFDELHLYHRRREALTLWSLLKQPLSELPQVVFALRAVQQPSSIPVSLASLNLITQTTSTFSYKVYKVIQQTGTIADSVAAVRELYEILELPNKIPDGAIPFPENIQKISSGISIEFKNVSFKYPGTDLYALREVSFKLQAGQLCVIVGVNGSGKSTILKLIVRLYDADEGQILVDGKDIKSLSLVDLRQAVSVLFQDYTHFPLSIRDNIGLGDPAHAEDDERISLAAKLGGSEEFINRLPDGLDTYLDRPVDDQYSRLPEGTKTLFGRPVDYAAVRSSGGMTSTVSTGLSGGQMQRLAVSRMFMRSVVSDDTKVGLLLFDEPSASLDPAAEHDLFARLRELRGSKTMLFSSHRFGNLTRHADLILYMDSSRIVETGTHDDLLQKKGEYARVWMLQAQAFL